MVLFKSYSKSQFCSRKGHDIMYIKEHGFTAVCERVASSCSRVYEQKQHNNATYFEKVCEEKLTSEKFSGPCS